MVRRLYTLQEIVKGLKTQLGLVENKDFFVIKTKGFDLTTHPCRRNRNLDRSIWCNKLANDIFKVERDHIIKIGRRVSSGEYSFAYIKFAVNKTTKQIYGVVHGKTSFHCMYPGDVWFYEFDDNSKHELRKLFKQENLEWYTDYIIVLKPKNPLNAKETYELEDKIKLNFNTFD